MTTAAATPINAFLLPPVDCSPAASAPPNENDGGGSGAEGPMLPESLGLSKNASDWLSALLMLPTGSFWGERAGAAALPGPAPNAAPTGPMEFGGAMSFADLLEADGG